MKKIIVTLTVCLISLNTTFAMQKPIAVVYSQEASEKLVDVINKAETRNYSDKIKQKTLESNIKIFLSQGADPNYRKTSTTNFYPLWLLAGKDYPELVKTLLNAGANPNIIPSIIPFSASPLSIALFNDNIETATILLSHGADPNDALLWIETDFINLPKLSLLLKYGANPNFQDPTDGFTPLMNAVATKKVDAVRLLLENGARTNITNNRGKNALYIANQYNAGNEIIELLHSSELKKIQ